MTSITRDSPDQELDGTPGRGHASPPPRRSAWLFRAFRKYARGYVRKHFHALRIDREGPLPPIPPGPLIVPMNHASWWDPLVGVILTEQFTPEREFYAPIDATGLAQYPFLGRLGFFGVELGTRRGGIRFLRQSLALLDLPEAALSITAQGHFADPRDRPVRFKAGIGHLVHRLGRGIVLPLAVEYPFWNDRCPEILVRFGRPLAIRDEAPGSPEGWTARLEAALEETQDRLAERARRRDPELFQTVIGGTAGVGGVYDSWRRFKARLRGESFQPEHRLPNRESETT
ncbi:MAG: lysophospholipid acyltransferase family protein [Isosphaeraceae bacterium]